MNGPVYVATFYYDGEVEEVYYFRSRQACEKFLRGALPDMCLKEECAISRVGEAWGVMQFCRVYKYRNVQEFYKEDQR